MYEMVIEFFNDSKKESNSVGFQKFQKKFVFGFFSLFLFFWVRWVNYRCGDIGLRFLLYRDKIRKIRRVRRKIETGAGLSLYISRILLFLKRNNGTWLRSTPGTRLTYFSCTNIHRVYKIFYEWYLLRNNPDKGGILRVECIFIIFSITVRAFRPDIDGYLFM